MPVAFGNIASEEQKTNDTCKKHTTEVILTAKEDLATPPTIDYNDMTEVVTPAVEDLATPPTNDTITRRRS